MPVLLGEINRLRFDGVQNLLDLGAGGAVADGGVNGSWGMVTFINIRMMNPLV